MQGQVEENSEDASWSGAFSSSVSFSHTIREKRTEESRPRWIAAGSEQGARDSGHNPNS